MSEHMNLYAAIWEQAVIDDMKRVVKHLSTIGIDKAHKTYCKLSGEDVPKDDERFRKINEDIKAYCKVKARAIDQRTRELIYQEAQDWPKNKRLWVSDTEYQEILKELEAEIKDFAIKGIRIMNGKIVVVSIGLPDEIESTLVGVISGKLNPKDYDAPMSFEELQNLSDDDDDELFDEEF